MAHARARQLAGIAIFGLVLLCGYQWRSLRLMKSEIQRLRGDVGAATRDLAGQQFTAEREAEAERALAWLDEYYRSPDGLRRPDGLCAGRRLDAAGAAVWLFGGYFRHRIEGMSEAMARQAVADALRTSDEWRQAHRDD